MQKFRDPISGLTHLASAIAAALGLVGLLLLGWGHPVREASYLIYGLSLILMFSASATYHLVRAEPGVIHVLRKIDHSAIYLLIAGSYTPICLNFFTGFWRLGLLAIIWGFAIVGVGIKVFVINAPRWITAGIYLVMGWLSIMAVGEMQRSMPTAAIAWLIAGGLFFSFGALIYILKKPDPRPGFFGFHEIWHIFVILGCLCHFILIAGYTAR
jgi:hemolysin III